MIVQYIFNTELKILIVMCNIYTATNIEQVADIDIHFICYSKSLHTIFTTCKHEHVQMI